MATAAAVRRHRRCGDRTAARARGGLGDRARGPAVAASAVAGRPPGGRGGCRRVHRAGPDAPPAPPAVASWAVSVVVYEARVRARGGGQTATAPRGAPIGLFPGRPPQPPSEVRTARPAEPVAAGAPPADLSALEAELRATKEQL